MQLPKGSPVLVTYSREKGKIIEWLSDDLALIQLDSSLEELPVEKYDLEPLAPPKAPGASAEIQLFFFPTSIATQYQFALTHEGEGAFLFELHFHTHGGRSEKHRGLLEPGKGQILGLFEWSELNESPVFRVRAWPVTNQGTGEMRSKSVRPKAKRFAESPLHSPLFNRAGFAFPVFSLSDLLRQPQSDLKRYTQERLAREEEEAAPDYLLLEVEPDLREILEFDPKIDLHIEALVDQPEVLPKERILPTQLQAFEQFMAEAHRLGIEKVFVIHGLGKGVLRNAIHKSLMNKAYVGNFKNEYHPSFGYGCTEVDLI